MKSYFGLVVAVCVASGSYASAGSLPNPFGNLLNLGDQDHANIIGGVEVQPGDPIAQSTIMIYGTEGVGPKQTGFICSGSILTSNIIITAAHCLGTTGNAKLVAVFRTDMTQTAEGPVIPVIYQTRPADFTSLEAHAQTDWDDLGILRLAQPIPQGYTPATIMNANEELQAGTPILLAGYGIDVPVEPTSPADTAGAGVLREVDQTIINPNYGQTEVLVSLQGKGACHGDSGGPAYVNEGGHLALFGVTSRLTNDDISGNVMSCSVDMVYTDILKRATWINAAVQKLEGLQAPPTPQEQAPEQIGGTTTKRGRHIPRG